MVHDWCKKNRFKSSAPGSLMLFGEHAVLHHRHALVVAVDQRIYASLIPYDSNRIRIESDLGCYETTLEAFKKSQESAALKFVLAAIQTKVDDVEKGFHLSITSDFSPTLGLGSSAAVVVAVLAVMSQYISDKGTIEHSQDNMALFKTAKSVIQAVQGLGSGADVAASVFGGVVYYCLEPLMIQPIKILPPLTTVYSGYKTPTPDVIRMLHSCFEHKTEELETIYDHMDLCTKEAKLALEAEDWQRFGHNMNRAQTWMRALKVSDDRCEQKISELLADPTILGAKISGAGLGDCVIGLGKTTQKMEGALQVKPALLGVCDHA